MQAICGGIWEKRVAMDYAEKYLFDLHGCLLVKNLLGADLTSALRGVMDDLEGVVEANVHKEPSFTGHYNIRYHFDRERGVSAGAFVQRSDPVQERSLQADHQTAPASK